MMRNLKKVGLFFLRVFEIYIPVIAFIICFTVFILQVFYRYVLNSPLTWPFEVTIITYIWVVMLGAGLARSQREHVAFTMIYDRMSKKVQAIVRIVMNSIISVAFAIAFYPVLDYVIFMHIKRSTVLRIPFSIVFSPFLAFLLLIIGHSIYDIIKDIKILRNAGKQLAPEAKGIKDGGKNL